LIREFLVWLNNEFMKGGGETARSWSQLLAESLNFWGLLEGTHLLFLMLFAGTIFIVDFRLLGLTFRKTPVSVVSDRVLPLTVFAFAVLVVTGAALFFAKPLVYYHNIWFRLKLIFLVLAMLNIVIFHRRVQMNQSEWDTLAVPPASARMSAVLSITSWILIITMGRFIAYNWFDCGKPLAHWMNVAQECSTSENGAVDKTELKKIAGAAQ
jgi:hypothetical protein